VCSESGKKAQWGTDPPLGLLSLLEEVLRLSVGSSRNRAISVRCALNVSRSARVSTGPVRQVTYCLARIAPRGVKFVIPGL
jgi:hypothetical protein